MSEAPEADSPPSLPEDLAQRADHLVSAGRIFNAALRSARAMRMSPQRAVRSAVACALHHTGIDWSLELDASDLFESPDAMPDPMKEQVHSFHAAWIAGDLGLSYGPALTTGLFELYTRWCHETSQRALNCVHFSRLMVSVDGLISIRKRWQSGDTVNGPHSFLLPKLCTPPVGTTEALWLGRCVDDLRGSMNRAGQKLQ